MDDKELGAIAVDYANRGWAVLPLHSVVNSRCSCGRTDCASPGKHPLNPNGVTGATRDTRQITTWWQRWPWANIGIATGTKSGIAVVDVDPRNGGMEHLDRLDLPETATVQTGSGGLHFYFSVTGPTAKRKLAPGIDFQADGGYVVAPPSAHVQGTYKWVSICKPTSLPIALLNGSTKLTPQPGNLIQPDEKTWVAELLTQTCPQGQRNETLTRLAGYFRNVLPQPVALTLLKQWNRLYCDPPLADREVEQNVRHKYKRYQGPDKYPAQIWTAKSLLAAELPEPVWVIEGLLPEGLAFLAGRPKRGKSWLALQLAIDVTNRGSSLGKLTRQGRAIYIALEDSPLRLQRRLTLMGAQPSEELLFFTEFPRLDDGGIAELNNLVDVHRPLLVIIDTLSRCVSRHRDQDKNADMTDLLDPVQKIALGYNCSIMFVDHHRKPGLEVADAIDDIMGSTAKGGVADVIWGLYRKSGESTGTLKLTGRDIEETELAVVWDGLRFHWRVEGTATQKVLSARIDSICDLLRQSGEADIRTISQYLQVSDDTATVVIRELRAMQLVNEAVVTTGQRGRPRFVYSLTPAGLAYKT